MRLQSFPKNYIHLSGPTYSKAAHHSAPLLLREAWEEVILYYAILVLMINGWGDQSGGVGMMVEKENVKDHSLSPIMV
ncbi:hypothetical protein B9Q04_10755 [Candidatus Marsarchaeota G2 archaeon BE_D]|uniref:Uncharacterized protein n=1 Tax=Candidatus Marsarchaeota G2 archaeon BE_D TaxID=1978158 RepID=A0A2R6C9F6_9ARCH|nr:MAG: hypothetical protein B9Q04_10755 [Candidatus Marsarchaeota G2 archaeon BE_D]